MHTRLNPYLAFRDNAREAMEFYRDVLGGELEMSTVGQAGHSSDPREADMIMHAMLTIESGMTLMGSDMAEEDPSVNTTFSISLSGDDELQLRGYWEKLTEGGSVAEPLETAPWGDSFGMCVDRFGVRWMVNIAGTPQE